MDNIVTKTQKKTKKCYTLDKYLVEETAKSCYIESTGDRKAFR